MKDKLFEIIPIIAMLMIYAVSGFNHVIAFNQTISGPPPNNMIGISFSTDKLSYTENEIITISGKLEYVLSGFQNVTIQIFNSNNDLKATYNVPILSDKSFSLPINSNKFEISDRYHAIAEYDNSFSSYNYFMVISKPYFLEFDHEILPINYTITDGKLDSILIDNETKTLTAHIVNAPQGSVLTLQLPRKIIDATAGGYEVDFTVQMRGGQTDFQKAHFDMDKTNPDSRTIKVYLSYDPYQFNSMGTWDLKIMSTKVIPEFPYAIPILVMSLASLLVFYKMKFIL